MRDRAVARGTSLIVEELRRRKRWKLVALIVSFAAMIICLAPVFLTGPHQNMKLYQGVLALVSVLPGMVGVRFLSQFLDITSSILHLEIARGTSKRKRG